MTHKKGSMNVMQHETWYLTIDEVVTSFGISRQAVVEIMDEGVLSPRKNERNEWYFDDSDVRKIRMLLQLQRDLGVNLAGGALALALLDEIDRLQILLNESNVMLR